MSFKEERPTVIAVVGPTASGKTALAVEIAKRHGGEVISCDSMQIYRGMDVGTAKVTAEEMRGVPHHLIDAVECTEDFSCAEYAELARKTVKDITARGGGTGLYLDSVLRGTAFSEAGRDDACRERLMREHTPSELYAMLCATDPECAASTHENNVKRVVRALEIFEVTGRTKTDWDRASREAEPPYRALKIGLDFRSRETLYGRIDKRVDIMMESGLEREVAALDTPAFRASTASKGIGYKEMLMYRDGKCSLSDAVAMIKQYSRNYAKRQLTWFRRDSDIRWIYPDDAQKGESASEYAAARAEELIGEFLCGAAE